MSDLSLISDGLSIDLEVSRTDLAVDDGLRSAVIVSLFSDKRVDTEELPRGQTDRRGWWGDTLAAVEGDKTGSKLWLLNGEKRRDEVLALAEEYAKDALAWLIEDGVADSVEAAAEFQGIDLIGLRVDVKRTGSESPVSFRFDVNWKTEASR